MADIARNAAVNVAYADPGSDRYVSVSGRSSLVEDMARKKRLWSKMAAAWFPGGVDDPDLALLKVEIVHAEFWDVKENKATQLLKMAKAAVTGHKPDDMGEHAKVRMR